MDDEFLLSCRKIQKILYDEELTDEDRENAIDIIKNSTSNPQIKKATKVIKDVMPHIFNKFINVQEGEANQIIELLRPFLIHCWSSRFSGVKYEW